MRKALWIIIGFLLCIFLICVGGVVFTSHLPKIVQSWLLPEIRQKAELSGLSFSIRKLDLFGIDVSDFKVNEDLEQGLQVDSVKIDFSPKTLIKKQIKSLSINGINLFCEYKNGQFAIPGIFPLPQKTASQMGEKSQEASDSRSAGENPLQAVQHYGVEFLKMANVNLFMDYEGHPIQIPLEATIRIPKDTADVLFCDVKIRPYGQTILVSANVNLAQNILTYDLNAKDMVLESFAALFPLVPDLAVSGHADVSANGELNLATLESKNTVIDANLTGFNLKAKEMGVTNTGDRNSRTPVHIHISGMDNKQWQINISGLTVVKSLPTPISVDMENFGVAISLLENRIKAGGQLGLVFDDVASGLNLKKQGNTTFRLDTAFEGNFNQNGQWQFNLYNAQPPAKTKTPWEMLAGEFKVQTQRPEIKISGKGESVSGKIEGTASLSGLKVNREGLKIEIPWIRLEGTSLLHEGRMGLKMETVLSNISLNTALYSVKLPQIFIKGTTENLLSEDIRLSGRVSASKATASLSESKIEATGIDLSLPLAWPCDKPYKAGEFAIGSIRWDKIQIGDIRCQVRQKGMGVAFDGRHQNKMIRDLIVNFSGQGGLENGQFVSAAKLETVPYDIGNPMDLGKIYPKASGTTVQGNLALSGNFFYDANIPGCTLTASFKNGSISQADRKITMAGIQTQINFPDVFQFKTAPKQAFSFDSVELANIKFENGHIEFQLESKDSFFIEKTMFNWCGGHVETQALRILPEKDEYDVVLYCDRLNLARILIQFGAADAEGEGTVSGRIPLRYTNGRWIFNDGFLYSSPGVGSRIKIQETEKWASAIPENTPQFDQIQLAQAAMKDYTYNWAKVGFHTEGEDLLLKLNFNGQPTNPIPFTFQKELGRFVKITAQDTHGMRPEVFLDLNFRLPLDEVLHYREFLDMIK